MAPELIRVNCMHIKRTHILKREVVLGSARAPHGISNQNFLAGGIVFGWAAISATQLRSSDGGPGLSESVISRMCVMMTEP